MRYGSKMVEVQEDEFYVITYTDINTDKYKMIITDDNEPQFFTDHKEATDKAYKTLPKGTVFEVFRLMSSHEVII